MMVPSSRSVTQGQCAPVRGLRAGPRLASRVAWFHDWWRRANARQSSVCVAGPMPANHPRPTEEVLRSSPSSSGPPIGGFVLVRCIRHSLNEEGTRPPDRVSRVGLYPHRRLRISPRITLRDHSFLSPQCGKLEMTRVFAIRPSPNAPKMKARQENHPH